MPRAGPDQRVVGLVDHAVPVVVLDQQHPGVPGQDGLQRLGPAGGERRAGRVLRPAGDHHRPDALGQGRRERVRQRALVVQPDGHLPQPHRGQQVEQAAPARVLDGHRVAGAQPGDEDALDGVERAGGDDDRAAGQAVGLEGGAGEREQGGVDGRVPVQDGFGAGGLGGGREGRGEVGQQCRVGVAAGEVPGVRRDGDADLVARGERGPGEDPAALAAGGLDHTAVAQQAVGRGDGVGVDAEFGGEVAQRGQRGSGGEQSAAHALFDVRRDFAGASPFQRIVS